MNGRQVELPLWKGKDSEAASSLAAPSSGLRPDIIITAGVLIVAASLAGCGIWAHRMAARLGDARRNVALLMEAGLRFNLEYGEWPGADSVYGDRRYGNSVPNAHVVNALRAVEGAGNEDHSVNPNRISFFDPPAWRNGRSGVTSRGEFLDPWGRPYQAVLDLDLNGVCEVPDTIHGAGVPAGIMVWSYGPDRKPDTEDDVLSWKR